MKKLMKIYKNLKMKKLKYLFIALIALPLLTNTSCNNDDDNDGFSNSEGCNASWKVDGVDFSQNNMAGCLFLDNTLNISTNITGGDFQLQINPITAPGTFVADPSNTDLNVVILLNLNDGNRIGIRDGSIVVTEISASKAKGTFSGNFFDLMDITQAPTFSVTDGSFEVDF